LFVVLLIVAPFYLRIRASGIPGAVQVIDRTFKFDDMVEVHRYLENSGQFGKIVVTL
jgi:Zinc-binding dehydrogenase